MDKNYLSIRNNRAKNKSKSNNKKKNNKFNEFLNNLRKDEKNRKEKIKLLNEQKEEKINSIYTFSPSLIENKNNEKYFNNLIDKLFLNNILTNINNKISNNNNNKEDINNKGQQLDIVLEENRKNSNYDFISRLNEYEKKRIENLEKIKNDMYYNENNFENNIKFNIEESNLLNSTNNFFIKKRRNIEKLIKEIDNEHGVTFIPKVNKEYNERIKRNKNLLNNNEYLNKMNRGIFEYLSNKDKECTFQPKINNDYNNNNNLEVCERLYNYQYKYKENLNLIKNKYSNFTFKPKISENTNIILNKKNFIKNLKEYIRIDECDNNLLSNNKENDDFNEKEGKLKENNKNKEKYEELDNREKYKNKFGSYNSDKNINNNIRENDNNINENCIYNNINSDNNNNNYFNSNDFKVFLINKEINKEADTRNNKKLMDFEYYNNIL